MDLLKKLTYLSLCASVAFGAFGTTGAWAEGDDATADITITVVEPSIVATAGANADFGQWSVVNSSIGPVATLTMDTDGTIDQTAAGAHPNARFFEIDDTAVPITLALTGGAFQETMSFAIGEDDGAGGIAQATVTLDGVVGAGVFTISNWNCDVDPAGAYGDDDDNNGNEVAETFTPDVAHATNGLATLTLGTVSSDTPGSVNDGGANIACGMDISTDGTDDPYLDGTYTGTVRMMVDYI